MWIVKTVISGKSLGRDHQRCLYRSLFAVGGREPVNVVLSNTETQETVYLSSKTTPMFDRVLAGYKPYGWVTSETAGSFNFPSEGDDLFVEIDDLSLQFLDYVAAVDYIRPDIKLSEFIKAIPVVFTPWDSFNTIWEWLHSYGTMACTLFQLVCYTQEGWLEDEYFVRVGACGLRVVFSDVSRARSLVSKAVSLGYNPLKKDAENLRFV